MARPKSDRNAGKKVSKRSVKAQSTSSKSASKEPVDVPASARESSSDRPEIVIGLVGAVGTPLDDVCSGISERLRDVGYRTDVVRISHQLRQLRGLDELDQLQGKLTEQERLERYMAAGTRLREVTGKGDVLAVLSIGEIWALRDSRTGNTQVPDGDRAYILRSLKHPDEVETLRHVYGEHFVLVAVGAPRSARVRNLALQIAQSDGHLKGDHSRSAAEQRIAIDERESDTDLGQNVRDTFPLADFFVDASEAGTMAKDLDRLLRLMYGDPFVTPSLDETAMFHAQAAALRSAALGRQVGAAIIHPAKGDLISVGMNDVPKAGGGHYWEGDSPDGRDFVLGKDTNDEHKDAIVRQVLKALMEAGWLSADRAEQGLETLLSEAVSKTGPIRRT